MAEVRSTQQTQDPAQRKTDRAIMADVIASGRGHITGIGPTIPKKVREMSQSSSSQSTAATSSSSAAEMP